MPPVEFEPTISVDQGPQTYTLDRTAIGTDIRMIILVIYKNLIHCKIVWKSHMKVHVSIFEWNFKSLQKYLKFRLLFF